MKAVNDAASPNFQATRETKTNCKFVETREMSSDLEISNLLESISMVWSSGHETHGGSFFLFTF